jgi:hypothetical protein
MKNGLLILLICVILSVGASVATTRMIVEPAKPKSVITIFCGANDIQTKIKRYSLEGYVVKTLTMTHYYEQTFFVVMEKY